MLFQKRETWNNKGMSVAITSVILLSITIASTLAVSAWVGAFSVDFMETEALWVSDISFQGQSGDSNNQIELTIANTGSYPLTIIEVKIAGSNVDLAYDQSLTINDGKSQQITLGNVGWVAGYKYQFDIRTGRQNNFVTTNAAY